MWRGGDLLCPALPARLHRRESRAADRGTWWPHHTRSWGVRCAVRIAGPSSIRELTLAPGCPLPMALIPAPSPASDSKDSGRQVCSRKQESRTGSPGHTHRLASASPTGPAQPVWPRKRAVACAARLGAQGRGLRRLRAVIWARTRRAVRPRCGRAAPCPPSGCSRRSAPSSRG